MLHLYQSNRLDVLLELLQAVVAQPLSQPFAPELIVVQSKGMGRWVTLQLAQRQGICANVDFILPATFVWRLFRAAQPTLPDRSTFAPEVLTWRILAALEDPDLLASSSRLAGYLAQSADARRYELAWRIADMFDQCLMYRADWIEAWEQGRLLGLGPDEIWQQALWQRLAAEDQTSHRARMLQGFLESIDRNGLPENLPERVILFGIASLPPAYIQILQTLGERVDVCLFLLNPSQEAWGDIVDPNRARADGPVRPEDLYLTVGNPLLASLGKQGRDFMDMIIGECASELHDLFVEPAGASLLARLQRDILNLTGFDPADPWLLQPDDRSVQIHACHSRMREVEVLHDQLLWLFECDPGLQPSDIVVLTPDIEPYAPLIDAVFARRAGTPPIPYGIADRSQRAENPVLDTFHQLLALPDGRFEVDLVMSLLECPALLRRFDLDPQDLPTLHHWVRQVKVRWGRDAAQKAGEGLPAIAQNTWREGLDRLLLGIALPQGMAGGADPLFEGLLPYDDIEGSRAELAGALAALIDTLFRWTADLARPRPLADWALDLCDWLDRLLLADRDEEAPMQVIREQLARLADDARLASHTQPVTAQIVRLWLTRQGGSAGGASGFLSGGVTFCTMVPMRSLPFRVVCLLGLNDGAFPRQQRPVSFDLMQRHYRRGDRSRRVDDRYLFLEALLSARDTLYLSYVGQSVRDGSLLPPSPLIAELLDVIVAGVTTPYGGSPLAQLQLNHPLQPFSPVYFEQKPPMHSYAGHFAAAGALVGRGQASPVPLFGKALPEAEPQWREVSLFQLQRFFSNPSRYLLQQRLGVLLDPGESSFDPREPFGFDYFSRSALREHMLAIADAGRPMADAVPWARADGLLAHGTLGEVQAAGEAAAMASFADVVREARPIETLPPLAFCLPLGSMTLTGALTGLSSAGLFGARADSIRPRDEFGLWIRHLLLCQLRPPGVALFSRWFGIDKKTGLAGSIAFLPVDDPAACLTDLLEAYWLGLHQPLPFFLKSSSAYVEAQDEAKAPLAEAHKQWDEPVFRQSDAHRGESEDRYYQAVYRGADPLDSEFENWAERLLIPMLQFKERP